MCHGLHVHAVLEGRREPQSRHGPGGRRCQLAAGDANRRLVGQCAITQTAAPDSAARDGGRQWPNRRRSSLSQEIQPPGYADCYSRTVYCTNELWDGHGPATRPAEPYVHGPARCSTRDRCRPHTRDSNVVTSCTTAEEATSAPGAELNKATDEEAEDAQSETTGDDGEGDGGPLTTTMAGSTSHHGT